MKYLFTKLFFVAILVLGISSFVLLQEDGEQLKKKETGNTRFNSEMDNGFEEREVRF